jgi:hypothetical protein
MTIMRTPLRPVPAAVGRWLVWARVLRGLDALVAWLVGWGLVALAAPEVGPEALGSLALLPVVALGLVPPLRQRWRPVSGPVGLRLSRALGPGDRAWLIRPGAVDLVVVTARRGLRVTIAARGGAEGVRMRRTRVLLVRAEPGQ